MLSNFSCTSYPFIFWFCFVLGSNHLIKGLEWGDKELRGQWNLMSSAGPGSPSLQFSSVQFSCSVVSDPVQSHGLQHARLPCPSPTPRACSNSCPSSQWCHPTISSSVVPFSSCLQFFPASGFFPESHFFISGGQNIGASASASVFPMISFRIDWFDLASKGLSRVFSNTTVQKH